MHRSAIDSYCSGLFNRQSPFTCPVAGCNKLFSNATAIKVHLYTAVHGTADSADVDTKNENGVADSNAAEPQFVFHVEIDGQNRSLDIRDNLQVVAPAELAKAPLMNGLARKRIRSDSYDSAASQCSSIATSNTCSELSSVTSAIIPLPGVRCLNSTSQQKEQKNKKLTRVSLSQLPYRRQIEKSESELNAAVEYELDELDYSWLLLLNKRKRRNRQKELNENTLEILLDRLEKEAYLVNRFTTDPLANDDEDVICSVCLDGECQNTNVILFCDACNMAVHQECYGVPYVPEGQWLCKRCQHSPNTPVDCCLCPTNSGSACKQTDDGRWAHVVCANWIPEVGFGSTTYMEPVCGVKDVPAARWKLACYICRKRGEGACIQCSEPHCFASFHVSCAQLAGLCLRVAFVPTEGGEVKINKTAFCHTHSPEGRGVKVMEEGVSMTNGLKTSPCVAADSVEALQQRVCRTRQRLAEKRKAPPAASVPAISEECVRKIAESVLDNQDMDIMRSVFAYWMYRRQQHNGAALLKRLNSSAAATSVSKHHHSDNSGANAASDDVKVMRRRVMCCRLLRQELARLQSHLDLVRKQEQLKRDLFDTYVTSTGLAVSPVQVILRQLVTRLEAEDTGRLLVVQAVCGRKPMNNNKTTDLPRLKKKVDSLSYVTLDQFGLDLKVMFGACALRHRLNGPNKQEVARLELLAKEHLTDGRTLLESVEWDFTTGTAAAASSELLDLTLPLTLSRSEVKATTLSARLSELTNQLAACPVENSNETVDGLRSEINNVCRRLGLVDSNEQNSSTTTTTPTAVVVNGYHGDADIDKNKDASRCQQATTHNQAAAYCNGVSETPLNTHLARKSVRATVVTSADNFTSIVDSHDSNVASTVTDTPSLPLANRKRCNSRSSSLHSNNLAHVSPECKRRAVPPMNGFLEENNSTVSSPKTPLAFNVLSNRSAQSQQPSPVLTTPKTTVKSMSLPSSCKQLGSTPIVILQQLPDIVCSTFLHRRPRAYT